jgi:hypothetical protein
MEQTPNEGVINLDIPHFQNGPIRFSHLKIEPRHTDGSGEPTLEHEKEIFGKAGSHSWVLCNTQKPLKFETDPINIGS